MEEAVAAGGIAAMPMVVEAYDGGGSGLAIGLGIGALAAMICTALIVAVGIFGTTPMLAMTFAGNIWMWLGILAGGTLICGVVGWFIGKTSE